MQPSAFPYKIIISLFFSWLSAFFSFLSASDVSPSIFLYAISLLLIFADTINSISVYYYWTLPAVGINFLTMSNNNC